MQVDTASVLLLAYKRIDSTVEQLNFLLAAGFKVLVSIDGPRNFHDQNAQKTIREEIHKLNSTIKDKIMLRQGDVNLGLAKAIELGIDWAFEHTNHLIVIEDDLKFDEKFLEFANKSLFLHENNEQVLLVSGNQFCENIAPENQATSYPLIWGWATTKVKWTEMKRLKNLPFPNKPKHISWSCYSYWKLGHLRTINNELNSWVLPIAAQMRLRDYYCICPTTNLVSNIGDDSNATHTLKGSKGLRTTISKTHLHDYKIRLNVQDRDQLDNFLDYEIYQIRKRHIISLQIYKLGKWVRKV